MKKAFGFVIVCILSFWSVKELVNNGYFPMHDDTQVARVIVMGRALRQGQFPVRWVTDLGYGFGYPIYNFYAPLPYYFGGGLYASGIDGVTATKLMFGAGIFLGAALTYLLLYAAFGWEGAVLGSLVFTYAPYHAVQVYVRGAVGEYWSIAFVPGVLLGLWYWLREGKCSKGLLVGAVCLSGAILSHTILGFLTAGLFIAGLILLALEDIIGRNVTHSRLIGAAGILAFGLGISAFFWLPAYAEMKFTGVSAMISGAPTNFFDHFVCLNQLWDSPWGYGGSASGCLNDGMSFKLGKVPVLLVAVSVIMIAALLLKKKRSHLSRLYLLGFGLLVISVFGMLPASAAVWRLFPMVQFIQYPWRLLAYSMLAMGIMTGYVNAYLKDNRFRIAIMSGMCVLSVLYGAKYFRPQFIYSQNPGQFESDSDIRYRVSKISDEYLPPNFVKPQSADEIAMAALKHQDFVTMLNVSKSDIYMRAELVSARPAQIVVNTAYFPGWYYRINGIRTEPTIINDLPSMNVPQGKSIIEARFENTQVRNIGNILSALSILVLLGIIYYESKIDD